ncbi:MAG: hypothetical protein LCI00_33495 [Chloroflexi bacterium]|nr:hypothetical protein [Chloroflexota bacterium]MCC6897068.1 hypothetical protein [Anaerolineae bacterium]
MKKLNATVISALVLAGGVFAAQAADPMPTPEPTPTVILPSFTDGRINAFDAAAPVVVFETYEEAPIVNDNGVPTTAMVVNGIQLLRWNGDAGSVTEVLNVPIEDIEAAIDEGGNSVMLPIASENGYMLNYNSETNQLWIQTPADYEGKVYTFSWLKDF